MKTLPLIASALVVMLLASCHKRGCTDHDAVNFDVTADEDDGTCIVCQSTDTRIDSVFAYLKDTQFGSIHYNQNVAKCWLYENHQTPSDKVCGKATGTISLVFQSLVPQTMFVYLRLYNYNNGPVNVNFSKQILINAHDTLNVGLVETLNNPPFLPISLDSIITDTQGNIVYH